MKILVSLFFLLLINFTTLWSQVYLTQVKQSSRWKPIIDQSEEHKIKSFNPVYYLKIQSTKIDIYKPQFLDLLSILEAKFIKLAVSHLKRTIPVTYLEYQTELNLLQNKKKPVSTKTKKALLELSNSSTKNSIEATLLLAWIYYLENNLSQSLEFTDKIYLSEQNYISVAVEILLAMHYLKKNQLAQLQHQIKLWPNYYPLQNSPIVISLAEILLLNKNYLLTESALKMKNFNQNESNKIEQQYFNLLQNWHLYHLGKYSKTYKNIKQLSVNLYSQQEQVSLSYFKLWTAFFSGNNYKKELQKNKTMPLTKNKNEFAYFVFLTNIKQKKIQNLQQIKGNLFYSSALTILSKYSKISDKKQLYQLTLPNKDAKINFYYNSQKANYFWEQNKLTLAADYYLRALSNSLQLIEKYPQKDLFNQTLFNLGLVYLKQGKIKKSKDTLLKLSNQKQLVTLAKYYLSIIYYLEKKPQQILSNKLIIAPSSKLYNYYFFLQNWANYQLTQKFLLTSLQAKQSPLSLIFLNQVNYQKKEYKKIIQNHQQGQSQYDNNSFYLLSLLEINKQQQALNYFKKYKLDTKPQYYTLYLKILLKNKNYQEIVTTATNQPQLEDFAIKALANYNLKNWQASIKNLETVLYFNINKATIKRIFHNFFLNLLFLKEEKSLTRIIDSEPKNSHNLWEKIIVYANFLEKDLQFKRALKLYKKYLTQNEYQAAVIQLLVQKNLYLQNQFNLCIKQGENNYYQENEQQKQDRLIQLGYCSWQLGKNFDSKLPNDNYRSESKKLLKLLPQTSTAKTVNKNLLSSFEKQIYSIITAKQQIAKNQLKQAKNNLNERTDYLQVPPHYQQQLLLISKINLLENQPEKAVRNLTRIIYGKIKQEIRSILILQAVKIMLDLEWKNEAKILFSNLKKTELPQELKQNYENLQATIRSLEF